MEETEKREGMNEDKRINGGTMDVRKGGGWVGSKGTTKHLFKQAIPPHEVIEYERASNIFDEVMGNPNYYLYRTLRIPIIFSTAILIKNRFFS